MTHKEKILIELQSVIHNLKLANHWGEVDRLADDLQELMDDIEEL